MHKIDPFTRTPGVAGAAYIDMHYSEEIIASFESDESSKYVYKIVGLRGSGKSVEYRNIIKAMKEKAGWLVYTLSAAGDPTSTLIASLSKEPFINNRTSKTTVSAGGSAEVGIPLVKGSADVSVSKTTEANPLYYSPEAALSEMIQSANDHHCKVLVGIDDISKTPEMIRFLSIWGKMLLEDEKEIYLICTGLSQNIEDFTKERSLSFFKRGDQVEVGPLDKFEISSMYQKLLGTDESDAATLARFTKGYAYAYQVLGSLYYDQSEPKNLKDLLPDFDRILFRDSYELVWETLTEAEKKLVKIIVSSSGKTSDIKSAMERENGYSSLRARLENKHLINTDVRGVVTIDLPRFDKFIEIWHGDEY